ncbi:hypothetical protein ES332_D07G150900v1 [Gossypium tomentosum]|uniref:Uncharacterized protein n=1 Tax=Gossypium tomentosum TaxID=34277 RepID=A0A5D2KA32_GOSTO|nr:hypothetical protein ES332_D07G150900v1 [Gossypium tomentosum]
MGEEQNEIQYKKINSETGAYKKSRETPELRRKEGKGGVCLRSGIVKGCEDCHEFKGRKGDWEASFMASLMSSLKQAYSVICSDQSTIPN